VGAESDDAKLGDKKIAILLRQVKIVGAPLTVAQEGQLAKMLSSPPSLTNKLHWHSCRQPDSVISLIKFKAILVHCQSIDG
jgi:hypothetical protein